MREKGVPKRDALGQLKGIANPDRIDAGRVILIPSP